MPRCYLLALSKMSANDSRSGLSFFGLTSELAAEQAPVDVELHALWELEEQDAEIPFEMRIVFLLRAGRPLVLPKTYRFVSPGIFAGVKVTLQQPLAPGGVYDLCVEHRRCTGGEWVRDEPRWPIEIRSR